MDQIVGALESKSQVEVLGDCDRELGFAGENGRRPTILQREPTGICSAGVLAKQILRDPGRCASRSSYILGVGQGVVAGLCFTYRLHVPVRLRYLQL